MLTSKSLQESIVSLSWMLLLANTDCFYWWTCPHLSIQSVLTGQPALRLSVPTVSNGWPAPVYLFRLFPLVKLPSSICFDCSCCLTWTHLYLFRLFLLADMHPPLFIPTVPISWPVPVFYSEHSYSLTSTVYPFWLLLLADLSPVYLFRLSPSICSRCSYWLTST